MLRLEDKKQIVAEVAEVAKVAHSVVAAKNLGLTVTQMTDLRDKARKGNVYLRVVRNTLARRALEGTSFSCLNEKLVGPIILAFAKEDPGSAARLLNEFIKGNDKIVVEGIALNGQLFEGKQLEALAKLPTRDEAIAQLLNVMKAPITQFVRTLAEPHAQFVRLLAAIGDKKQAG